MSKYIDLSPQIMADQSWITDSTEVDATLEWLDSHSDEVPGRTITNSEMGKKCELYGNAYLSGFTGAGGVIVSNPEPTNAELINEAYDVWDRDPQDYSFGEYLDRLGWVKAGGDDEA